MRTLETVLALNTNDRNPNLRQSSLSFPLLFYVTRLVSTLRFHNKDTRTADGSAITPTSNICLINENVLFKSDAYLS